MEQRETAWNMIFPLAIVQKLKIPTFVVFDSDGDESHPDKRSKHEKDNKAIQTLCGVSLNPFPTTTFWENNLVCWATRIGIVVEGEFVANDLQKYQAVLLEVLANTSKIWRRIQFSLPNGFLLLGRKERSRPRWKNYVRRFCGLAALKVTGTGAQP